MRLRGLDLTRQVVFGASFPLSTLIDGAWPDRFSMPVLCLLSLISLNSPKQLGMVSPELASIAPSAYRGTKTMPVLGHAVEPVEHGGDLDTG